MSNDTSERYKPMSDVLRELDKVLAQRKDRGTADSSYVAQLHAKGLNKILEKVGEECTETIIAAKDVSPAGSTQALVSETADLWFHSMVMLSHLGCNTSDVLNELARRFEMSGLDEKASRNT